jgi:RND family efflux transporter MFP subunit
MRTNGLMRVFAVLAISMVLFVSFTACGKKTDSPPTGETPDKAVNKDGDIDVDKLDIPDRMKEAIKSGRIPMERVKQFLAMRNSSAPLVKIERVKRQPINAFLVLNGTVEPERKVEVYSRLSAYVKEIVREEGALVKKDDVLALLDDTEISILHRQAQLQMEQAQLTLETETANYERSKELKKTEMISDQDYQLSETNYNKAKLDFENKQESFKDLELQLSYTKITAPVEGYVTERLVEVGSRVNANQQLFTVEDFFPLLVKVYVPSSDVVNLKEGMETEVNNDVLGGMVFKGKIKLINPRIDVQSGTVKVTIEVYDKTQKLKPGMFVETKILIRNKPDAVVIPRKAVSYKENEAYIFIFDRQTMEVSLRFIETGISEGDNIEVTKGLEENEPLVTVGVEGLKDKMKVSIEGFGRSGGPGGSHSPGGFRGPGTPGGTEGFRRPGGTSPRQQEKQAEDSTDTDKKVSS